MSLSTSRTTRRKSITWAAIDAVLEVERKLIEWQRKQEKKCGNT